jgi:hypothetical protein
MFAKEKLTGLSLFQSAMAVQAHDRAGPQHNRGCIPVQLKRIGRLSALIESNNYPLLKSRANKKKSTACARSNRCAVTARVRGNACAVTRKRPQASSPVAIAIPESLFPEPPIPSRRDLKERRPSAESGWLK